MNNTTRFKTIGTFFVYRGYGINLFQENGEWNVEIEGHEYSTMSDKNKAKARANAKQWVNYDCLSFEDKQR